METERESFVAECFWPDVDDGDLAALDRRIDSALGELAMKDTVRYVGSMLLREDEVVLCRFEGPFEIVRAVAERAEVPFARILVTVHSPWPSTNGGTA